MSVIKRENYINIQGWMITDLNLKGNDLLIYAIIYGFTQDGQQWFEGSRQYLAEWCNSTKRGISKNLDSLTEKGYIIKEEQVINNVKFCKYKSNLDKLTPVNKVHQGGEQSSSGGGEQSSPNNIDIYNIENNIYKKEKNSKKEKISLSLDSKPMEENFHTPTEENFHTPTEENFHTPMEENFQDNNTVINIKNKKEKNSKKEKNEINEQKQEYELLELKRVKETVIQKVENVLLQKKILNFLNFRIKNKKPVTIEYIRVFLEKLDKLSNFNDNEKIEILNQSIERGYTTIYAVRKSGNSSFYRNNNIDEPESYNVDEYEKLTSNECYLDNMMNLL